MSVRPSLKRIISGGQTGADRAALCAAKLFDFETGGTAPRGFITTLGPDPTLKTRYNMTESTSTSYVVRSKRNVENSDATIAFRLKPSVGTDKTVGYCATGIWQKVPIPVVRFSYRPCLVVDNMDNELDVVDRIIAFIRKEQPVTLNVCGHRDGMTAGMEDFETAVQFILSRVFKELKRA